MSAEGLAPVPNRGMITISIMLANIMQGVDNTILNVALPHIQRRRCVPRLARNSRITYQASETNVSTTPPATR